MPFWRSHYKQKQGQPIPARGLRQMAEDLDKVIRLQADPPLSIVSTAGGPLLRLAGMLFSVYIGVTTTTVSARSGTTPGSGTVKLQTWNGSVMADLPGPITVTAYNISSSSSTIGSGKYCIILRIAGAYWFITVEC